MSEGQNTPHPYQGRKAVLTTKHQKERVLSAPLQAAVGFTICVPDDIDTDLLGTFTGEIDRRGTPREVALQKARLGMKIAQLSLGLASEGSFGPHPQWLFVPADHELLAFVDDDLGIEVVEQILSTKTNFANDTGRTIEDLNDFLARARFPSHGVIVRRNSGFQPELLFKGITTFDALKQALQRCVDASMDGLAHVETDMRAHINPTRRQVLGEVAMQLGRRLAARCPRCRTPGWGLVDVSRGLPCEWCGGETNLVREEIHGCPRCEYHESYPRSDGLITASPDNCPWCNP
ncbi:MAG: hypothetical protein M0Z36_00690 [Thermaerobacter sp.]|nr:hypothetical protein [Thermaerobacter sp.]